MRHDLLLMGFLQLKEFAESQSKNPSNPAAAAAAAAIINSMKVVEWFIFGY